MKKSENMPSTPPAPAVPAILSLKLPDDPSNRSPNSVSDLRESLSPFPIAPKSGFFSRFQSLDGMSAKSARTPIPHSPLPAASYDPRQVERLKKMSNLLSKEAPELWEKREQRSHRAAFALVLKHLVNTTYLATEGQDAKTSAASEEANDDFEDELFAYDPS